MFKEISTYIINNPGVLAGIFTIFGAVLGATITVLAPFYVPKLGRITFTESSFQAVYLGRAQGQGDDFRPIYATPSVALLSYRIVLRILNKSGIERSIALNSVEFFASKPSFWQRRSANPMLTQNSPSMLLDDEELTEITIPPRVFRTITVRGRAQVPGLPIEKDKEERGREIEAFKVARYLRIGFTVSPSKKRFVSHSITETELPPLADLIEFGKPAKSNH